MEREGQLDQPFGQPSQWYNYKCVSCNYKTEIEDLVVDAYFYSQGCEKRVYPTFICPPQSKKRMKYASD